MPQVLAPAAPGFGSTFLTRDPVGTAKGVADPADPGEVELALEIAPARQDLWRHRIEHRLEPDMVAGVELVARLGDVQAQAVRLTGRVEPGQEIRLDNDPPALLGQIDVDDPSGEGERSKVPLQHRRLPLPGGFAHQRKAGGKGRERERSLAPSRMTTQRAAQGDTGDRGNDSGPQRRFEPQGKIHPDPGAEENRQPEQAPLALGNEAVDKGGHDARGPRRHEADPFARNRRIRHHCSKARAARD
jgi:hypothetical protein